MKKVFAVISWPWGLRIDMADNIRGAKRVDAGPDRKGEFIVYMEGSEISTPPSSRLVPVGYNVAEDYPSLSLLLVLLTTDLIL